MFLDIVGVITRSKVSILSTFQEGAPGAPPPCQVGLRIECVCHLRMFSLIMIYSNLVAFTRVQYFVSLIYSKKSFHLRNIHTSWILLFLLFQTNLYMFFLSNIMLRNESE